MKLHVPASLLLLFIFGCVPQKKLTLQYVADRYTTTQNQSFLTHELLFLHHQDTLRMNVRIPFNHSTYDTVNNGIFHRCFPKKSSIYAFKLKPIRVENIPTEVNSYYKTNAVFKNRRAGAAFREIKKNTEFLHRNPGKYIDIDHRIYEIMEMWPDTDCAFE